MFIVWCSWQYLRIIMFLKNQKKAQQSANQLVDFSTLGEVENDAAGDIVFDMRKLDRNTRAGTVAVVQSTAGNGITGQKRKRSKAKEEQLSPGIELSSVKGSGNPIEKGLRLSSTSGEVEHLDA